MPLEQAIQDALSRSELPLKAAEIARLVKPAVGSAHGQAAASIARHRRLSCFKRSEVLRKVALLHSSKTAF
jgi:hypothetical protein